MKTTKQAAIVRWRQQRAELEMLRARYDSGAVSPATYLIIRGLEIELAWVARRAGDASAADPRPRDAAHHRGIGYGG